MPNYPRFSRSMGHEAEESAVGDFNLNGSHFRPHHTDPDRPGTSSTFPRGSGRGIVASMLTKLARLMALAVAALGLAAVGYWQYVERIGNPRVERELIAHPDGPRARRVLVIELPSGRRIPVNYIREIQKVRETLESHASDEQVIVYVAADGVWWSELTETAHPVTLLLRGETVSGLARTILDDPERTADVFTRLRPDALEGFGTLVEIRLLPASSTTN